MAGSIAPHRISNSVANEFPWPWAAIYWGCMAFSGMITLYGIFDRKIDGLLIERAGLMLLTAVYGLFVYAVIQYAGLSGFVGAGFPIAFAIGNLWRCWQIRTDLVLLKSYLRDHPGEQVR
jgi:hypothetical protein